MAIEKIYLHWSATGYNFTTPGAYHTVVQGDGRIIRLTGYDQLSSHTYRRNSNAAGIACACMAGPALDPFRDFPPTQIQVERMCQEAAELAKRLGWTAADITDLPKVSRIMTHAEAAANRDFPETLARLGTGVSESSAIAQGLPHDNYGPSGWPDGWPRGTVERWDFFMIKEGDPKGSGGDKLRQMIRQFMGAPSSPPPLTGQPCDIYLNETKVTTGRIFGDQRCYVKVLDIINPLGIEFVEAQGGSERFISLKSDRYSPRFLADSPLLPGFQTVDIYLNRPIDSAGNVVGDIARPITPFMGGLLINNSTHILVGDFCDELGIRYQFRPEDTSIRITTQ